MANLTPAQILRNNLNNVNVKERFEEILKQKAPSFIASILALANSNTRLETCYRDWETRKIHRGQGH